MGTVLSAGFWPLGGACANKCAKPMTHNALNEVSECMVWQLRMTSLFFQMPGYGAVICEWQHQGPTRNRLRCSVRRQIHASILTEPDNVLRNLYFACQCCTTSHAHQTTS